MVLIETYRGYGIYQEGNMYAIQDNDTGMLIDIERSLEKAEKEVNAITK